MRKISLDGLEFFAYHGFYKEEQTIGNKYGADITVWVNFTGASINDSLNETVNYEKLYQIIRKEMGVPSKLLEHIGQRVINSVFDKFPDVEKIEITIRKFNPPVGGICRAASIVIEQTREEFARWSI